MKFFVTALAEEGKYEEVLRATQEISSVSPSRQAGDRKVQDSLELVLHKLCYETTIKIVEKGFYTNEALMEIFVQNFLPVYDDLS